MLFCILHVGLQVVLSSGCLAKILYAFLLSWMQATWQLFLSSFECCFCYD